MTGRDRLIGNIYAIPLEGGHFGFAKALVGAEVAFLDLRSETEVVSMDLIGDARTLFRIYVMKYALTGRNSWKRIGKVPLEEHEKIPNQYRIQDSINNRLRIYQGSPFGRTGEWTDHPATADETRHLEAAAAWDPCHVESRLNDYFAGRENVWVKNVAFREG